MAKNRRRRGFVGRFLPWAVLIVCAVNWFWSTWGWWWIELGSTGVSLSESPRPGRTGYVLVRSVQKGLYSFDGRVIFSRGLPGGPRCMPGLWQPVYTRAVAWSRGPDIGTVCPFKNIPNMRGGGREVGFSPWDLPDNVHAHTVWKLGFEIMWDHDIGPRGFAVPWWFLCAVFAITPTRQCIRIWTLRKLRRRGLCPSCGYDLVATPERCPECGRAATAQIAPSLAS